MRHFNPNPGIGAVFNPNGTGGLELSLSASKPHCLQDKLQLGNVPVDGDVVRTDEVPKIWQVQQI